MVNIQFKHGKIHKVNYKESYKIIAGLKLKCGLVAKSIIATRHQWHFTIKKATCEHCLKKGEPKKAVQLPTDLSNYHTFIKK